MLPPEGDDNERFCGSLKLFRPDGSFMRHEECPMAWVISGKVSEVNDEEVIVERPKPFAPAQVLTAVSQLLNSAGSSTAAE
jgi:hypothetical protein